MSGDFPDAPILHRRHRAHRSIVAIYPSEIANLVRPLSNDSYLLGSRASLFVLGTTARPFACRRDFLRVHNCCPNDWIYVT